MKLRRMRYVLVSGLLASACAIIPHLAAWKAEAGTAPQARAAAGARWTLSPAIREAYTSFWSQLPRDRRPALERQLLELEARGRRGEKVEQELGAVRRAHPNLVGLSDRLTVEIRNHGAVECQGIGWLAIDAKAHCSGTLNVPPPARLGLAASPPEPYCIGASSCDLMFSACHKKGLKTECNFTCFPWDGCCIGSCDSRER